jgi:hypothetical protein
MPLFVQLNLDTLPGGGMNSISVPACCNYFIAQMQGRIVNLNAKLFCHSLPENWPGL